MRILMYVVRYLCPCNFDCGFSSCRIPYSRHMPALARMSRRWRRLHQCGLARMHALYASRAARTTEHCTGYVRSTTVREFSAVWISYDLCDLGSWCCDLDVLRSHIENRKCVNTAMFFFLFLFSNTFIISPLLFSLPPSRNSDPGSHIAGSFPLPTTYGSRPGFLSREDFRSSSLVDSRRIVPSHAKRSQQLVILNVANKVKISPRRDSDSRTNTSRIERTGSIVRILQFFLGSWLTYFGVVFGIVSRILDISCDVFGIHWYQYREYFSGYLDIDVTCKYVNICHKQVPGSVSEDITRVFVRV